MRYFFLALFAVSCYTCAMMVEPDEGYTPELVKAVDAVVDESRAKPHTAKQRDRGVLFRPRNEAEVAEVMTYLFKEGN